MYHVPVLLEKAVELLVTNPNGFYVDGTLGGGNHTQAILNKLTSDGRVAGFDQDMDAIEYSCTKLVSFGERFTAIHDNFTGLRSSLADNGITSIDGLLLDLGVSSHQIDKPERGFSFDRDGPLDMRMNRLGGHDAGDIINSYSEQALADVIYKYGEERYSRKIARAIVKARRDAPFRTTARLKTVIAAVTSYEQRAKTFARVFQALRIEVNDELQRLGTVLRESLQVLVPGGRIVVISYHSLEDRICKLFFRQEASRCSCPSELPVCVCNNKNRLKILTRRPVKAGMDEIKRNPRSRSAKLRAAEYIGEI